MKRIAVLATIIILLVLTLTWMPAPKTPADNHTCRDCNVLLIMIDTLAAGHIGAYGYERDTMPRTEAFFRKHGMIFTNTHAQSSWTLPSFMSLFFSDLPSRVTYADIGSERPSLQKAVRDAGGLVRGIVLPSWFFISQAITLNFKEGETTDFIAEHTAENLPALPKLLDRWQEERRVSGKPFFGFAHTFLVHDPYDPVGEYLELFEKDGRFPVVKIADLVTESRIHEDENKGIFILRYDQEIREADDLLGAFLESLTEEDLANTAIIISSDHGEAFGQHDQYWHGHTLYEEETHVPLFVYAPGGTVGVSDTPVMLMDIAPTALDLMNAPIPESFKGKSLIPLLYSNGWLAKRIISAEHGSPFFLSRDLAKEAQKGGKPPLLGDLGALGSPEPIIEVYERAAWTDSLKLIERDGVWMLFDLQKDSDEKTDLLEDPNSIGLFTLPDLTLLYWHINAMR